ncbi:MAG: metallophosphoesterase [Propionibacteriaceae bacterium]|jgi:Icc-related predicted phosphoesterase|nr:metallophosphoesterase [Propionibacteriaceae bacterium]
MKNRIMLVGDTHGNPRWTRTVINQASELGVDLLIQLGDFGYWPRFHDGRDYLHAVEKALAGRDLSMWFLDGNHEDHVRLRSCDTPPGRVAITDHIGYLPRGTRWQWGQTRWLALGGAVSVDQSWRTPGHDWFAEETITTDQQEAIIAAGPADVVIAHDAPWGVPFLVQQFRQDLSPESRGSWPAAALIEADAYQQRLRTILEAVQPQTWFHAHYHVAYQDTLPAICGDVKVIGLDCDGGSPRASTLLVDATGTEISW